MPARKRFMIDVFERRAIPALHRISLRSGDEIEWTVNDGNARVVFEPGIGDPVTYSHGPDFNWQNPAVATAKTVGAHLHSICFWYSLGGIGQKKQGSLAAVLIIDP